MVRERPSYNPVAYPVPQYIDYLMATGETTRYEALLDAALEKRLIKCDRYALFIPLKIRDSPVNVMYSRSLENGFNKSPVHCPVLDNANHNTTSIACQFSH